MTFKKTSEWTPPRENRDGGKAMRARDRQERNLKNTLRSAANLRYLRSQAFNKQEDDAQEES
ncbi:MAG: hypothetical protein DDT26_01939 [Dehalococcoidia bacterium]|nr:hypothetical protein [Chloroflexota bacterium]